jgi:carboxypeptidase Taq
VRITTRFEKDFLQPALFGTMHEAGHAMYEQGINHLYARTPLGTGVSMGVHESQSRLWENLIGRSRAFWNFFYPRLQSVFPDALGDTDFEAFYRAVNTVAPSLIRVEADEVTYNLHTLLRFELEVALLDGTLSIAELPEAWNAKMKEYLGVSPASDADGALQDIHWSGGMFAYFPTYTIGNVLAVQLFDAAKTAHPTIMDEAAQGEFTSLHSWLTSNIYQHGSKYEPQDLIERATGSRLDTAPYIRYLREKFGELYEL